MLFTYLRRLILTYGHFYTSNLNSYLENLIDMKSHDVKMYGTFYVIISYYLIRYFIKLNLFEILLGFLLY